ncbi:hypothetical protein [Streptomyces cyslabdanicus]|uniref:hypothetical protein n=1 Tax=Streptomyces cyslabdanicus TaxID=1470456 RepID=UPI004044D6E8
MTHLPYEEITEPSFGARAAVEFSLIQVGPGAAELRGPCPRCRTTIRLPVVNSVYKNFRLWRRPGQQASPPSVHEELVICTCAEDHPGRPEGKVGCGAFWRLEITPS